MHITGSLTLLAVCPQLHAQKIPEWQTRAGGKMAFDVASVRPDTSGKYVMPPFSIDSDDDYVSTGGAFNAIAPLETYISFAYKLDLLHPMISNLPKWGAQRFAIQAKVDGNPTKDQMRLMMQALLLDRFKLVLHFEPREIPVFALTLIRPGRLGPKLRLHADGPTCDVVAPNPGAVSPSASIDMFPCNAYMALDRPDHQILTGARNTTARQMAAFFSNLGGLGRTVVDHTGIVANIDFAMEFLPERAVHPSNGTDAEAADGETFLEAAKNQLGLQLKPITTQLDIPVIDHVEVPSEN